MFKKLLLGTLLAGLSFQSFAAIQTYTDRAAFNQAISSYYTTHHQHSTYYTSTETFDKDDRSDVGRMYSKFAKSGVEYFNQNQLLGTVANGVFSDTINYENLHWNWPIFGLGPNDYFRYPLDAIGADFKLSPTGSGLSIWYIADTGGSHLIDLPAGYDGFIGILGVSFNGMGLMSGNQQITLDNLTVTSLAPINPVPEPEVWAMMLAGLGLVSAITKIKRLA